MRTVWKFELEIWKSRVFMPAGAKVLAAQMQGSMLLCLWAEVDTSAVQEERRFEVFDTGQAMPVDMGVERAYVATVQDDGWVGRVYERVS